MTPTKQHRERAVIAMTGFNFSCFDVAAGEHWAETGELPDDPNHPDGADLETADAVAQSLADLEATIHARYAGVVKSHRTLIAATDNVEWQFGDEYKSRLESLYHARDEAMRALAELEKVTNG